MQEGCMDGRKDGCDDGCDGMDGSLSISLSLSSLSLFSLFLIVYGGNNSIIVYGGIIL